MTLLELDKIKVNTLSDLIKHTFNFGIFKGGEKITQRFNDKDGLSYIDRIGHDGIDMIPAINGNNDVFAVEDGEVLYAGWDIAMKQADKAFYQGFGILSIIWNEKNNRTWIYAHLSSNIGINKGMKIKRGEKVGNIGGSGFGVINKWATHLHLELLKSDNNANIINRQNGFWGGINPTKVLEELKNNKEYMNNQELQEMYNYVDYINFDIWEKNRGKNLQKQWAEKNWRQNIEDVKNLMIQRQDLFNKIADLQNQLKIEQNKIKFTGSLQQIAFEEKKALINNDSSDLNNKNEQRVSGYLNRRVVEDNTAITKNQSKFAFSFNKQYETFVKSGFFKYFIAILIILIQKILSNYGYEISTDIIIGFASIFGLSGITDNITFINSKFKR